MYLLKLSFRPWRIAPLNQMISAFAVGSLLLLIGFLFWMQRGLWPVLNRLQGEQVITAYLNSSVESKEEEQLVDTIRVSIGSQRSTEVKLMNAPRFIEMIKGQYPELGHELEDLGKDMNQVIPRYISVSGILPDSALDQIRDIPGVESAESSKDRSHSIVEAFSALRWIARILMGGVFLALLTGLIHLSRMNAYLHKDALMLLKFWGAGSFTLLSPGMISGLVVGFLGGGVACSGWLTMGVWLTHHVRNFSFILKGMPAAHGNLAVLLFFMGGLVGLVAGFFGSLSTSQLSHEGGFIG